MTARRNKAVLPGLSRSIKCQRSAKCQRLDGHKGSHRQALMATKSPGIEVHSSDRYVAPVEPKVPAILTIILDGVEFQLVPTSSAKGVKAPAPKARKASPRKVRQVAPVEPKARIGVSGIVGQHRTARRAKAGPTIGRDDVTIKEALGILA